MIPHAAQDSPDWQRPSSRRRAIAIALTLAAELFFLLILLGLNPVLPSKILTAPTVVSLDLSPATPETRAPTPRRTPKTHAQMQAARPTLTLPRPKPTPTPPSPLVSLSKSEMAQADIAHLGTSAAGASSAGASAGASFGPGQGPGGAHLYNAEWYREPTDGELAGYLPKTGVSAGNWAMIACQTIARYHVENCYLLGESPPGSGLARALREAAWQFLVRPPNLDGKPLIGSWVRIKFEWTKEAAD